MANIGQLIGDFFTKTKNWCRKNSPQILTGLGIASAGAAVAFTVKGTIKAQEVLKPANKKIEKIKKNEEGLTDEEVKEKVREVRKEVTPLVLKAYAPTTIFFGMSVAAILGGLKIEKGREVAIASAYVSLKESYDAYKAKVEKELGPEKAKELAGIKVIEDKNGKKHVVEEDEDGNTVSVDDAKHLFFDSGNAGWTPNPQENFDYLISVMNYLNDKLKRVHVIYLDDVYKQLIHDKSLLSIKQRKAGKTMVWRYDPNNNDSYRDNFISFGISDIVVDSHGEIHHVMKPEILQQINEGNGTFLLEFNFDGPATDEDRACERGW